MVSGHTDWQDQRQIMFIIRANTWQNVTLRDRYHSFVHYPKFQLQLQSTIYNDDKQLQIVVRNVGLTQIFVAINTDSEQRKRNQTISGNLLCGAQTFEFDWERNALRR